MSQSGPAISNYGKNTMSESWKWIITRLKLDFKSFLRQNEFFFQVLTIENPKFPIKKFCQVSVKIRQIYLKLELDRNRILSFETGNPVGSYLEERHYNK